MDVERAIEHLLDLHAKAEGRHAHAEARLEKLEKDLSALVKMVRGGATALFKIQERNSREIKALTVETRALAGQLGRLEKALRPGGNGRPNRQ